MVIKRPTERPTDSLSNGAPGGPDFNEQIVKRALDVNPALKGGRDTQRVLEELRQQAVAMSRSAAAEAANGSPAAASAPRTTLAERRKSTIAFFFEQKASELDEVAKDIAAQQRVLEQKLRAEQRRIKDELVDFLSLMPGASESPEAREVIRDQRPLLQQLGTNEVDLVREAQNRR